jgi:competence protein ComEC
MKASSLSHLTAVSGANCALIVAGAFGLAALCGARRGVRVGAGLVALGSFVILVSPEPSGRARRGDGGDRDARHRARSPRRGLASRDRDRRTPRQRPWLGLSLGFALSSAATGALLVGASTADGLSRWMPQPLASRSRYRSQLRSPVVPHRPDRPQLPCTASSRTCSPPRGAAGDDPGTRCVPVRRRSRRSGAGLGTRVAAGHVDRGDGDDIREPPGASCPGRGMGRLVALSCPRRRRLRAGPSGTARSESPRHGRSPPRSASDSRSVLSLTSSTARHCPHSGRSRPAMSDKKMAAGRRSRAPRPRRHGSRPGASARCLDVLGIARLDLLVLTHFDHDRPQRRSRRSGRVVDRVLHGPVAEADDERTPRAPSRTMAPR